MAKINWVLPPNHRVPQNQFFTATEATIIPLIARAAASQTANVFEVRNSADSVLFSVNDSGNVTAAGTVTIDLDEAVTGSETITGNLTVNGNTTLGDASSDTLTINATSTFNANVTINGAMAFQQATTISSTGILTIDATTRAHFNAASANVDFQVEGATNARMIFVDAGLDTMGFGGTAAGEVFLRVAPSYVSNGSSSSAQLVTIAGSITGAGGDTIHLEGFWMRSDVITQTATESVADIAQLKVEEPNITDNLTGDITIASTLLVTGAPTEGVSNYGLSLPVQTTIYSASATNVFYASFGIQTHTATSARTLTNVATVYIEGAPDVSDAEITATNGPYALWVNNGVSRFDGRVLETQGADVASAINLTLGTDGNTFELTGTTKVDLISNIGWQEGATITLIANESVTIGHGTASSGANITLVLNGGVDYSMTATDTLTLVLGSTTASGQAWFEIMRSVN